MTLVYELSITGVGNSLHSSPAPNLGGGPLTIYPHLFPISRVPVIIFPILQSKRDLLGKDYPGESINVRLF